MSAMLTRVSRARGWRKAGAQLTLLIALEVPGIGTALSQAPAQPGVREEIAKQEKIYGSRGADVPAGYITNRSLRNYAEVLPSGFMDELKKLGPADRWLDIGAGAGQAILDYHAPEFDAQKEGSGMRPAGKASAVAVSIEDRRAEKWPERAASLGGDRIRYLHGKRLREYSREELGKFRLITDVFGGFSYTDNLAPFVERVLDLLELDGAFYTLVQSVRLEDGKDDPRTWYLTELVDTAGRNVKVCSWLKSISCVRVACESKSAWDTPTELVLVRKTCNDVSVPPMKLLKYEAGNPPERRLLLER